MVKIQIKCELIDERTLSRIIILGALNLSGRVFNWIILFI